MSNFLNKEALINALNSEIESLDEEIKHAAQEHIQWYDKAAKLSNKLDGIKKAKFLISSGDFDKQEGEDNA